MSRLVWSVVMGMLLFCGASLAETVRLPESEAKKALVKKVDPAYPPMAKQMRVSGRVELEVYIDEQGNVEKTEGTSGNPILTSAASSAVKHWKFSPATSGGKPAKVVTTLTFDFKL